MGKKIVVDLEVKSNKGVKEVEKLNKELKTTNKELGGATDTLDKFTGGAVTKIKGFKGAIKGLTTGFKSLRVAIIATGIGALIVAITAVGQAFTRSEEGQNKFAKLLGVIGSVVNNLLDVLADLGESIISVFENPKKAIKDFTRLIRENITNRFEGMLELIPKLGKAINQLFKGNFSEAGKIAADAVGKVTLGVESITTSINEATKSINNFAKEINKEAKLSQKIADQRAKADKIERKNTVDRAKANQKISELRFKAEQREKFSAEERVAFLKEASKLEEETTNKEIEAARLRFEAKKLENELSKSGKQDKDEEARLEAQLISLTTSKLNLQKRLQTSITTFQNEVKAKKQAEIKAEEEEQKKIKEEQDNKIKKEKDLEIKRLESIDKIQQDFKKKKQDEEAQTEIQKIELEQQRTLEELDRLNATEEQKANIKLYYADLISKEEKKNEDTKIKLDKIRTKQTLGDAQNTFNQIAQLAGKDSKVGKAMAIASATISGVQGVQNAYTTAQKSPITLAFPAYPAIQAGLAGAIALKNIASIKSVNPSGGGGSNVPKPSVPAGASTPPSFNVVGQSGTNQLAEAIGSQSQQPVQAYVVANDVTTAQSMDRNIIDDASIGG